MPFVTRDLMLLLVKNFQTSRKPLFVRSGPDRAPGFPFVLSRETLKLVSAQIERGELSLGALAKVLQAKSARLPRSLAPQLTNINEPNDLEYAIRRSNFNRHHPTLR